MRVPLSPEQIEQARQFAADLGRDADELIREAEEVKGEGYLQAYQAASATVAAMGGLGLSCYPTEPELEGPDPELEPELEVELG
jgi:hypothetical protein